jgi:putative oxidoreductase
MALPLVINMLVIIFKVHAHDFFGTAEKGSLYLAGFFVLLLCGPGKVSVDGIASK